MRQRGRHPFVARGLQLAVHVDLRVRLVADQHDGQPGRRPAPRLNAAAREESSLLICAATAAPSSIRADIDLLGRALQLLQCLGAAKRDEVIAAVQNGAGEGLNSMAP